VKTPSALFAMAALGGITVSISTATAQTSGFYLSGGVGPAYTEKTGLREFNGPLSGVKVHFDPGFQFRFTAGYRITPWLATELETGVTYNNIDSITGASEANGSLVNAPLLANLVVQCPSTKCRLTPYIGGGLGGSSAVLDAHDITINGVTLSGTKSDGVFAYQGFAGLRYHIDNHMSVSLAYRYFGTTAPTWEADFGPGRARFGDDQTHSVTASFTYDF
jgi:OmpA-OmpF porin, OOP family